MAFCTRCGNQLPADAKFCTRCGAAAPVPTQAPLKPQTPPDLNYYPGQTICLPFLDRTLTISAPMDAFNHYRKQFRKLAKAQLQSLRQQYFARVTNLDAFFIDFPVMYEFYRQPMIDAACNILMQAGIYDISVQQFTDDHVKDFCLCGEDLNVMIDSFNKTIEANQENKARNYNMLPGVIFSGITGIALAFATNVAVNAIAEADIRNADVNPRQRQELFARIDPNLLLERAYLDYWRVFLTMTWIMRQRGLPMWYPTDETNRSSDGIYQNLKSGRIPADKVPELTCALVQTSPFHDDYLSLVKSHFGRTEKTAALLDYFEGE